jgi:hypothetical protein
MNRKKAQNTQKPNYNVINKQIAIRLEKLNKQKK